MTQGWEGEKKTKQNSHLQKAKSTNRPLARCHWDGTGGTWHRGSWGWGGRRGRGRPEEAKHPPGLRGTQAGQPGQSMQVQSQCHGREKRNVGPHLAKGRRAFTRLQLNQQTAPEGFRC